ncbi:hypothetical protein BZL42_04085 [Pseudomonas indica]|nr:hypothetical protein BZL42_04085 [Pseudomonas indica]
MEWFEKTIAAFSKSLGSVLEPVGKHLGVLSALAATASAVLSFAILMTYAKAIGRIDLLPLVLDKRFAALLPWMGLTALFALLYILVMLTTTASYAMAVSIYNDTPTTRPRVATLLLWPAIVGSLVFVGISYQISDIDPATTASWVFGSILITMFFTLRSKTYRLAISLVSTITAPKYLGAPWHQAGVFALTYFTLAFAVVCAVYPVSLLLHSYAGEDTPEAVNTMMFISMLAVVLLFLPAWVFFTSKQHVAHRSLQALWLAVSIVAVVIFVCPGASSTIVYSAAGAMGVRDLTPFNYRLLNSFDARDFDEGTWGKVSGEEKMPTINAFPLFSLGDVLLLCPANLKKTKLAEWPQKSLSCILTRSSDVVKLPKVLEQVQASSNTDSKAG